jgi:two-component system, chemotaxis family, chemotaxis protein CheY
MDRIRPSRRVHPGNRNGDEMPSRALIVDDSRAIRMLLAKTVRQIGYEVEEAANGKEALEIIEAGTSGVDLVLVDWNMPEMNGLDLLKKLRQNPALSSLRVVMVTTETEIEQIAEAMEAGANEYVMKPFTPEILLEKLELAGIHP